MNTEDLKIEYYQTLNWVNVNYQLPDPDEKVLIQYGDENVHIGRIDKDGNWWIYWMHGLDRMDIDLPITHWMELPMPIGYFQPLEMTPLQIAVYALNCPKEDKYFDEVADLIQRYAESTRR